MIHFSYTTFITSSIFFSLCSILLCIYLKRKKSLFYPKEVAGLLLICGFLSLRLMLPIEFPITRSVYLTGIYATFCSILRKNILFNLSLVEILFILNGFVIFLIVSFKIYHYKRFCILIEKQGIPVKTLTETSFLKRKAIIPVIQLPVIQEPFIIGVIHPKIIIPAQDSYNFDYVIRHELQHYRNHDLFYKMLLDIVSAVYWWNPLVYILKRYTTNLFELYNDFSITMKSSKQEKIEYTKTLLHAARKKKGKYVPMGLGISSNESFLKTRVHSIFNEKKFKLSPFIVLICCFVLFSFFVVIEPRSSKRLSESQFSLEDKPYLVEHSNSNGYIYDIYIGETFMGTIEDIPKEFANLKIIKEK